ncbi:AlpA family transcriptional regulator [Hylemonella gracilis]|uniref:AlpA family transcriptional regulator n=2 Tax=Hylemonella gracilis TaxID=80880 RepID=A0A4P6ULY3_9BURK|nr:AlpA family transcriptional regulator [Hylemonella gracilis]
MSPQVIRLPGVRHYTGLSRSTIYALVRNNDFPKPLKLGPRASGWLQAEVSQWLKAKTVQRDE